MNRNFLTLLLLVLVGASVASASPVTVRTPLGEVRGTSDGEVVSFKGIPYAKPPVGELAYAPTQPVEPWECVLDATRFGPSALQVRGPLSGSSRENMSDAGCLTLNVWAPAGAKPGDGLPVYVFIHGGAYAQGSGSVLTYHSKSLARDGIVAVTINYRLNAQGFLATRATLEKYGTTGNWGHLDQIEALKWVRANIASFGGDPAKVTIGGESAGSFSVSTMILSPLAKGLFRAAIMESGTILGAA
ncbi:MAG: carboxylesterase family protein, partial [Fretibacterium sp.]|nr:carboxylesterase family protein [Fretibacterium sp.]